jgi:mannose-6-phosphate isomerase-like protein (cupin superfamily)
MISSLLVALLAASPAPAAVPVHKAATVDVLVTDRRGKPLPSANVSIEGSSQREGRTDSRGRIVFKNVAAGAYMLQVERDAFVTFGKEFTVAAGHRPTSVVAALSSLSSIQPRKPLRGASAGIGDRGEAQTVSIPMLAKQELGGRNGVAESSIGCAGATGARLLQLVEPMAERAHREADEMLYVVSGEATLELDGRREAVKAGSFSIIPRGTPYSLERKGRRPAVLLSVVSGQACPAGMTRAAR